MTCQRGRRQGCGKHAGGVRRLACQGGGGVIFHGASMPAPMGHSASKRASGADQGHFLAITPVRPLLGLPDTGFSAALRAVMGAPLWPEESCRLRDAPCHRLRCCCINSVSALDAIQDDSSLGFSSYPVDFKDLQGWHGFCSCCARGVKPAIRSHSWRGCRCASARMARQPV